MTLFFDNFHSLAVNLYNLAKFKLCTSVGLIPINTYNILCKISMGIPMTRSKIISMYIGPIILLDLSVFIDEEQHLHKHLHLHFPTTLRKIKYILEYYIRCGYF